MKKEFKFNLVPSFMKCNVVVWYEWVYATGAWLLTSYLA